MTERNSWGLTVGRLALFTLLGACAPETPGTFDESELGHSMLGVGTFAEVTGFGNNPGGLRAYAYVPENMPANAPMVLALHPCSLNASDYRRVGWEAVADRLKFYVLYPEQQTNNNALRCFNWAGEFGDPPNLRRGEGENQSIKQMIDKMKADHSIDNARVFIMGHSGGAAQAALMGAVWPELFAGVGILAGIPYDCTRNFNQVTTCLTPGIDKTPQTHGDLVRAANRSYSGAYPKFTIWHGSSDTTVATANQREMMEQWTNVHGIDQTVDATSTVDGATRSEYKNAAGQTLVETITIPNFTHGTPVRPMNGCGTAGSFTISASICAVERMAEFFGLSGSQPMNDTVAPTVNITAPNDGQTVSGRVTVQITAQDNVAVTGVELFVNGQSRGTRASAPYTITWDASALPAGQYRLRAVATDAAGNDGTDDDTTVRIVGGATDTTPPTVNLTAPASGATVSTTTLLTADATDDVGVTRVEFFVNGTKVGESTSAPYSTSWDVGAAAAGTAQLSVKAYDAAGNVAEDADTSVTVQAGMMTTDTTAPMVTITAPAAGATISGLVTVKADATDDTRVAQVLMFARNDAGEESLLGTDFRAPYEFLWSTDTEPVGARTLVARAFDAAGNLANSAPVNITITRAEPTPEPTPSPGGGAGGNGRIKLGKSWGCSGVASGPDLLAQLALVAGFVAVARRRKS